MFQWMFGLFPSLAIVTIAAMNIHIQVFVCTSVFNSFAYIDIHLGIKLLGDTVIQYLAY